MVPETSHRLFNDDGSISVQTDTSKSLTTFNDDGSITNVLEVTDEGGLISQKITQNTLFNEDGSIDKLVTTEAIDNK